MLTVTGPYPLDELRRIAERDIEPRLVRLPGVASAHVDGGLEREIRVELDPVNVAAFGLGAARHPGKARVLAGPD